MKTIDLSDEYKYLTPYALELAQSLNETIASLEAENAKLKDALRVIWKLAKLHDVDKQIYVISSLKKIKHYEDAFEIARGLDNES